MNIVRLAPPHYTTLPPPPPSPKILNCPGAIHQQSSLGCSSLGTTDVYKEEGDRVCQPPSIFCSPKTKKQQREAATAGVVDRRQRDRQRPKPRHMVAACLPPDLPVAIAMFGDRDDARHSRPRTPFYAQEICPRPVMLACKSCQWKV